MCVCTQLQHFSLVPSPRTGAPDAPEHSLTVTHLPTDFASLNDIMYPFSTCSKCALLCFQSADPTTTAHLPCTKTVAPARASCSAVCRPIPSVLPVMRYTRPASPLVLLLLLLPPAAYVLHSKQVTTVCVQKLGSTPEGTDMVECRVSHRCNAAPRTFLHPSSLVLVCQITVAVAHLVVGFRTAAADVGCADVTAAVPAVLLWCV